MTKTTKLQEWTLTGKKEEDLSVRRKASKALSAWKNKSLAGLKFRLESTENKLWLVMEQKEIDD